MSSSKTKVSKRSIGTYTSEERLAMMERARKKVTSSKEEALKFLQEVGILDKEGNVTEPYQCVFGK